MADNTTPELTDQQIELAEAFNMAADIFVSILTEEYVDHAQMGNFSDGQIISRLGAIAAESVAEITSKYGYDVTELTRIIRAAVQERTIDVENAISDDEQEEILGFCKNSILQGLFLRAQRDVHFPLSIYTDGHPDFDTPKLQDFMLKYL